MEKNTAQVRPQFALFIKYCDGVPIKMMKWAMHIEKSDRKCPKNFDKQPIKEKRPFTKHYGTLK